MIKSNKPGCVRLAGRLKPVDMDPITGEEAKAFIDEHVPEVFRLPWEDEGQVDFAYAQDDVGRFRVNGFHQRGTVSVVQRRAPGAGIRGSGPAGRAPAQARPGQGWHPADLRGHGLGQELDHGRHA